MHPIFRVTNYLKYTGAEKQHINEARIKMMEMHSRLAHFSETLPKSRAHVSNAIQTAEL